MATDHKPEVPEVGMEVFFDGNCNDEGVSPWQLK